MVTALGRVWNSLTMIVMPNALTDALLRLSLFLMREVSKSYCQVGSVMPLGARQTTLFEGDHSGSQLIQSCVEFFWVPQGNGRFTCS
jgi:hypothetical protein